MSWEDILKGPKWRAAKKEVAALEGQLKTARHKMSQAARAENVNVSRAGQRGTTSKPKPTTTSKPTQEVIQEEPPKQSSADRRKELLQAAEEERATRVKPKEEKPDINTDFSKF